jgi:hypothetical protein
MRRILMILAAGLMLGACADEGDDTRSTTEQDEGGESEEYIEATAAALREDEEGPTLDEEQATCLATGMVDLVGVDALREAGISPEELTDAESFADLDVEVPDDATERMTDTFVDCELVELLEGVMTDSFVEEFGADVRPDATACLADRMDDQAVAEAFAASFVGGSGSQEQIAAVVGSSVGACPEVASLIILSEAPDDLSPDAEACVRDFVEANPELVSDAFASGEGDSTETQQLGVQLATACPDAFAG